MHRGFSEIFVPIGEASDHRATGWPEYPYPFRRDTPWIRKQQTPTRARDGLASGTTFEDAPMAEGRGWHGDPDGHREAGKRAHETRLQTAARRLKERLPIFGGGT